MATKHEFKVGMTCGGCSGAVQRIVGKIEGVELLVNDVETQKVVVSSTVGHEVVLEKLTKWANAAGKELAYVGEVA